LYSFSTEIATCKNHGNIHSKFPSAKEKIPYCGSD